MVVKNTSLIARVLLYWPMWLPYPLKLSMRPTRMGLDTTSYTEITLRPKGR